MAREGGGWTGLDACDAIVALGGTLAPVVPAPVSGVDDECRPFTQDDAGDHTYHLTFSFPPGYREFYLSDYRIRAHAVGEDTSEIREEVFAQTDWSEGFASYYGDVSFGTPDDPGPVTSFARELEQEIECSTCEVAWPSGPQTYELLFRSNRFRIGWGEQGPQLEGWYPWWSGRIFLR